MSATLPAADFVIADLNLWLGNGISNNPYYQGLLQSFTSVSGLSTEALLKIGTQVYAAPTATFSALGTINGQAVTTAATYEAALLAPATGNRDNLKCGLIFEPHIIQNMYSSVLAQVFVANLLDDVINSDIANEEGSFLYMLNGSLEY